MVRTHGTYPWSSGISNKLGDIYAGAAEMLTNTLSWIFIVLAH